MKNYRIIERTYDDGDKCFLIQKRGFIFRWVWHTIEDEEIGAITFKDFELAEKYINKFSNKKYVDRIVCSRKEKLEKLLEI